MGIYGTQSSYDLTIYFIYLFIFNKKDQLKSQYFEDCHPSILISLIVKMPLTSLLKTKCRTQYGDFIYVGIN